MRRIFPILFILIFTTGAGYVGNLPNIEGDFEYKKTTPQVSSPPFTPRDNDTDAELKKIPRDNKSYIEIIVKKDKSSQYANDTNDIIQILEKLQNCLENKQDIQKFNAIVSNLIDHISLMQETYKNKPEANYISYKTLLNLSDEARNVAVLRTEGQVYNKYLPYSSSGAVYAPSNIQRYLDRLLSSVNTSLYVLKNID
ncbi:MAG: hypothetical protein PHV37_05625 [Candidatus Gastranaerophilales bacterium]|nr:hypothetical protein [Candidatus Gastranaerophilales bacterium]